MKRYLIIAIALPLFFSCSNQKKEREEILMKIINENQALQKEQSKFTESRLDELNRFNNYIMEMSLAGATKIIIDSLENEKKGLIEGYDKKLKEVETSLNMNFKKIDSITSLNK